MRISKNLILLASLTAIAGCGHSALPTATLQTVPAADEPQTIAPVVTVTQQQAVQTDTADSASVAPPKVVAELMAASDVRRESSMSVTNILDPWRPIAFGVVGATHNSVTLAWRTELDTRATVYYGKTFGFEWTGFSNVFPEDRSCKNHVVTIGGLSRFTKYRFVVVGRGPLGTEYPSYAIEYRTRLFF